MPAPVEAEMATTGASEILIFHSDHTGPLRVIVSRSRTHRPGGWKAPDELPLEQEDPLFQTKQNTEGLETVAIQSECDVDFIAQRVQEPLPGRVADTPFHDLVFHPFPLAE